MQKIKHCLGHKDKVNELLLYWGGGGGGGGHQPSTCGDRVISVSLVKYHGC